MTTHLDCTDRDGCGRLLLALCAALVVLGFACDEGETGDDANDGEAASGSGGSAPLMPHVTGGSSGGSSAAGSGVAGSTMSSGGAGSASSAAGSGGTAAIAGSSGASGQSGSGDAGETAGTASMVDAGETMMTDPTPSAGCAQAAGRPAGGVVAVSQNHYFAFPESYDGTKPFPVLIGFHGCGAVNRGTSADDTEWLRLTDGTAFEDEYVRVVPLSADSGGCWNYDTDIQRVIASYDELLASYCVDTSRVFGTGHSSGAQFVVQILGSGHTADAQHLSFKGVAPVAASDYGPMTGPIPVMYIQGMMDAERGNGDGHETVARFRAANGCDETSMPYGEVDGCQSGATSVNPGCVVYDGCDAPTIWCSHNDPQYSGTMHGVPCFGITAMHDFFESL